MKFWFSRGVGALLVLWGGLVGMVVAQTLPQPEDGTAVPADVLDMAVQHCLRGQALQAQALFDAIREQLEPPAAVLNLIDTMQQSGCGVVPSQLPSGRGQWRVGLGYDDNVTQGIQAGSIVLGSAQAPIELWVDETYKPISSPVAEASADYLFELGSQSSLQTRLGARQYADLGAYNMVSGGATLRHPFQWPWFSTELQADWNELWLGGQHYQSMLSLGAVGGLSGVGRQWRYHGLIQQHLYHTQPQQNALQTQLGLTRSVPLGTRQRLQVGGAVFWDQAQGNRAGGSRAGYVWQTAYQYRRPSYQLGVQLELTHWTSRDVFMPGLVDEPRTSTLVRLGVSAEYPLTDWQTLVVGWQSRCSRDSVALYTYRTNSIMLSWVSSF